MIKRLLFFGCMFIPLLGCGQGQSVDEIKDILDRVNPDAIRAHMTFLSDDLLEGRAPGGRGFALGSKYIETQFISLGLKPAIGDSAYIQKVPLRKAGVDVNESSLTLTVNNKDEKLVYGSHFIMSPYFASEKSQVSAPLVFVGFGVSAPELNYDDYKNIDVKGKIVVFINDAPNLFKSSERAYYSSADVKYTEAVKRGAVGVIRFNLPSNKRSSWDAITRQSRQGTIKWLNNQSAAVNSYEELKSIAILNNAYVEKLFVNAATPIEKIYKLADEGKSLSFPLKISASMHVETFSKRIESSNVVGIIEGSDPVLKNEYLVYTAHLDHFGIGAPVRNDSIYNGAHDDASGMAILLEIARAYRSLPVAQKRSLIIAVVTGEEYGLLGSDYLANNQPVKNGRIVAAISIDMPFFFHPVLDIVPYGAEHSSIGKQIEKAANMLKLSISPDPFPDQVLMIRSDHYSFVRKGIPVVFIKSGFKTIPQDTVDRAKSDVGWRSTIYHTPQDDMHQPFDFKAATAHVKVNFLVGYMICNEPDPPVWNKGDFFKQKFETRKNSVL